MSTLTASPSPFTWAALVDDGRVVGSIGRDGCYPIVDLFDEDGHPCTVSCPPASQIRGDDLTSVCGDRQV